MPIQRSEGITPSEQYLKKLCDHAFLSLWSYSNVYRDQGPRNQGKELCDLLVVFENHILIFSDKYVNFPISGNIRLDWGRWFKRAVYASAKQIWGAERWIKSFPERIFLDKDCTHPFPFELSNLQSIEFHRIVIAHGVAQKCRMYFNGGSGSLLIDNTIINGEHFSEDCQPFTIGQTNPSKGYVHVFDEVTLDVILKKLDTVSDFLDYIMKKEVFLTNRDMSIFVAGEEELLAYYLQQLDEDGNHNFILPKENLNAFALQEGFWVDFIKSSQFQSQLEANQISYSWDALIETFNKHILDDTQHYAYPHGVSNQEKTVKFLAKENRTRRRMLAKSLYEILGKTQPTKLGARVMLPSQQGDPYYVFLLLPKEDKQSEDEYREMRREVLESYCMVTKYKFPEAEDIIGFATESGRGEYRSEDLIYLNTRQWTKENQQLAKHFHDKVGLLRKINRFAEKEYEYPIEKEKKKKRTRHRSKKR